MMRRGRSQVTFGDEVSGRTITVVASLHHVAVGWSWDPHPSESTLAIFVGPVTVSIWRDRPRENEVVRTAGERITWKTHWPGAAVVHDIDGDPFEYREDRVP